MLVVYEEEKYVLYNFLIYYLYFSPNSYVLIPYTLYTNNKITVCNHNILLGDRRIADCFK